MPRSTYYPSGTYAVVDPETVTRDYGRQIDWANVDDSFKNAEGKKVLPAFTCVGDLLGNGKVSPRVLTTNPAIGGAASSTASPRSSIERRAARSVARISGSTGNSPSRSSLHAMRSRAASTPAGPA